MAKKKLIILVALVIWLANYWVCFCGGEGDFENVVKSDIAYLSDNHTDTESVPASENTHFCCCYCCGHQAFFSNLDQVSLIIGKPPTFVTNHLSTFFSGQLYLTSIFHPPKA